MASLLEYEYFQFYLHKRSFGTCRDINYIGFNEFDK